MNYENFCATLAYIEQHPEQFNQALPYERDTAFCFLAHARRLFGDMDRTYTTYEAGARVLGLPPGIGFADWLYSGERTLDDFRRVRYVEGMRRAMAQQAA